MNHPYDALFFDIDGTLLDFALAQKNALKALHRHTGSALPPEEFRRLYNSVNHALWAELEAGKISAEGLKSERFRRFAPLIDSALPPREMSDFFLESLAGESHFIEGAAELLRDLAGRYPMAVITNGLTRVQEARQDRPEFREAFGSVVISEKAGVAKPGREIFEMAAAELGIALNKRVLMVGDGLGSDIAGGIAAGISTCWFNPGGWENASPWIPDREIRRLEELRPLLLP